VGSATDQGDRARERRRRRRLIALQIAIPVILISLAFGYFRFVRYVEHDPGFCANCHATRPAYDLWSKSEHASIACQSCHQETQSEALEGLIRTMSAGGPGADGKWPGHSPQVPVAACANCHFEKDATWPHVERSPGHRVHILSGAATCLDCHGGSIHDFKHPVEACKRCHETQGPTTSMRELHCLACHNFLSSEETIRPDRQQCLECHRSEGLSDPVFPNDAHMASLSCSSCHLPCTHTGTNSGTCRTCHDDIYRHGLHEASGHVVCTSCHIPHTFVPTPTQCAGCHQDLPSTCEPSHCTDCHAFKLDAGVTP
jgi:hypothetical protein